MNTGNLSQETYKQFAEYYDLYVGNYSEDLEFYKSLCSKQEKIIEIGCGTGRVLKSFLDSGYSITGVDISSEMLDISKRKLAEFIRQKKLILLNHNFLNGSIDGQFDKALVTFYTFNYIVHDPINFLKNIYITLHDGGVLIMDLFYPQSLTDRSLENRWREHDFEINGRKIILKDKRCIKNNIEQRTQIYTENIKEIQIETERRYYNPDEIKNYLEKAGFRNIEFSLTFLAEKFSNEINESDLAKSYLIKAIKV